jgi:proteasome assembly chaperone 3
VTVPLLSDNPTDSDPYFATSRSGNDLLLPSSRFQPRTILGAGSSDREMMGQLYASQLASMITTKNPEEQRPLLLGLGLAKADTDRDIFLEIVNLALEVI